MTTEPGATERLRGWNEDRLTEFLAPKVLDIVVHEKNGTVLNLRDEARAGMWARSIAVRLLHAVPTEEALAVPSESSDLLAAVEALPGALEREALSRHGVWSIETADAIVATQAALRSVSTSREAGLDAALRAVAKAARDFIEYDEPIDLPEGEWEPKARVLWDAIAALDAASPPASPEAGPEGPIGPVRFLSANCWAEDHEDCLGMVEQDVPELGITDCLCECHPWPAPASREAGLDAELPKDDLPARIVVGANGAYWRDFGTHFSMCPVSEDNDPVVIAATYVRDYMDPILDEGPLAAASPVSREAGLDAERLAHAYNNAIVTTGEGHGLSMTLWREVAAEYARLAATDRAASDLTVRSLDEGDPV